MSNSSSKTKRWLVIGAILIVIGVVAILVGRRGDRVDSRLIGKVERRDLIQRITVAGSVVARRSSLVQPTYAAYVSKLFVKLGDRVRSGDPLISLSQNPTDASGAYPMRAPFAGTIVQVLVDAGDYVDVQTSTDRTLLRIDDLSQIYVEADVPELEYPKIVLDQEVIVKASAILSRSYKGKVLEKFLAAKKAERWERGRVEYPVRIRIEDADEQLRPGMSAIVDIVAFRKDKVLTLRQEFVQNEGDRYFVVTKDGRRLDVKVGAQNDELFEITGGIDEGVEVRQVDFLALEAQ